MKGRGSTLGLVRASKGKKPSGAVHGQIVTWDLDRRDLATNGRLRRFIFGYRLPANNGRSREYQYAGFVQKDGVYYLGQSVVFVEPRRVDELIRFLEDHGVTYEGRSAILA